MVRRRKHAIYSCTHISGFFDRWLNINEIGREFNPYDHCKSYAQFLYEYDQFWRLFFLYSQLSVVHKNCHTFQFELYSPHLHRDCTSAYFFGGSLYLQRKNEHIIMYRNILCNCRRCADEYQKCVVPKSRVNNIRKTENGVDHHIQPSTYLKSGGRNKKTPQYFHFEELFDLFGDWCF